MNTAQIIRWSGAAAIVAGAFGMYNAYAGEVVWAYTLSMGATLFAFVGIYLYQRESAGTLGLVGFVLAAGGLLLEISELTPGLSNLILALGVVILAIASLRADSFPKWVPWFWIAAPVFGILGFALPEFEITFFLLSTSLFGLGMIGAGARLWRSIQGVQVRLGD